MSGAEIVVAVDRTSQHPSRDVPAKAWWVRSARITPVRIAGIALAMHFVGCAEMYTVRAAGAYAGGPTGSHAEVSGAAGAGAGVSGLYLQVVGAAHGGENMFVATLGPEFQVAPNPSIDQVAPEPTTIAIRGFVPSHGVPGTVVRIRGRNFGSAPTVRLADLACEVLVASRNLVVVRVPERASTGVFRLHADGVGDANAGGVFRVMTPEAAARIGDENENDPDEPAELEWGRPDTVDHRWWGFRVRAAAGYTLAGPGLASAGGVVEGEIGVRVRLWGRVDPVPGRGERRENQVCLSLSLTGGDRFADALGGVYGSVALGLEWVGFRHHLLTSN